MTDRAVSTVVGYAIGVVMVAMLVASLSIAANGLVETNQERATKAALEVHAERLAADIETADRLSRQGPANVTVETDLPQTIGNQRYGITIDTDEEQTTLRLEINRSADAVEKRITTARQIETKTVRGGSVTTSVDTASDERVVIERD